MLAHSSNEPQIALEEAEATRDSLTQILLGLRLEGVAYDRCVLHGPWAIGFPAQAAARFLFVARGTAWLQSPGSAWMRLEAGDALLLPHGGAHVLASDPEVPPVALDALERTPVTETITLVRCEGRVRCTAPRAGAAAPPDVVFCGSMRFNLDPLHPLMALMPERMHAGALAQRDPTVPVLLEAMEREVALDRIGSCGILARLADVLAASVIRAWVECGCSDASGWIAALRCPRLGQVVAAIHREPARDWRVAQLAALMGASRSRFADAFTRTLGESPARYVAKVRMSEARRWIAQEGMRVAVAAHRLGYDSEAAFSRAFKRIVGQPPSALRLRPDGR